MQANLAQNNRPEAVIPLDRLNEFAFNFGDAYSPRETSLNVAFNNVQLDSDIRQRQMVREIARLLREDGRRGVF